jgi:hypothetical protein
MSMVVSPLVILRPHRMQSGMLAVQECPLDVFKNQTTGGGIYPPPVFYYIRQLHITSFGYILG